MAGIEQGVRPQPLSTVIPIFEHKGRRSRTGKPNVIRMMTPGKVGLPPMFTKNTPLNAAP